MAPLLSAYQDAKRTIKLLKDEKSDYSDLLIPFFKKIKEDGESIINNVRVSYF